MTVTLRDRSPAFGEVHVTDAFATGLKPRIGPPFELTRGTVRPRTRGMAPRARRHGHVSTWQLPAVRVVILAVLASASARHEHAADAARAIAHADTGARPPHLAHDGPMNTVNVDAASRQREARKNDAEDQQRPRVFDSVAAALSAAETEHRAGNLGAAAELYAAVLEVEPSHARAELMMGAATGRGADALYAGDMATASRYLSAAVEAFPNAHDAMLLASVRYSEGDNVGAARWWNETVRLDRLQVDALVFLGDVALQSSVGYELAPDRYADAEAAAFELSGATYRDTLAVTNRIKLAAAMPLVVPSLSWAAARRDAQVAAMRSVTADLLSGAVPLPDVGRHTISSTLAFEWHYHGLDDRTGRAALSTMYRAAVPALTRTAPHVPGACRRLREVGMADAAAQTADTATVTDSSAGTSSTHGAAPGRRIRVGFVSRFFRDQSVGKLLRGVICGLDRRVFDVSVLLVAFDQASIDAATTHAGELRRQHGFGDRVNAGGGGTDGDGGGNKQQRAFEALCDSDDVVYGGVGGDGGDREDEGDGRHGDAAVLTQLALRADRLVSLPWGLDEAQVAVAELELDVLVYGEVGMERATYLLAHARLAPVQVAFWGHPITTAIDSIDYFLVSEAFLPASRGPHDDPYTSVLRPRHGADDAWPTAGTELQPTATGVPVCSASSDDRPGGLQYTEAGGLICLQSLSTHFYAPRQPAASHTVVARETLREVLINATFGETGPTERGAEACHVYFVPQTPGKLTPQFDAALAGIVASDPRACIVLLSGGDSSRVGWWPALTSRWQHDHASTLGTALTRGVIARIARGVPLPVFLALAQVSHAVLDPFPVGGGVTSLEILAVDAAIVTSQELLSVVALLPAFYCEMGMCDTAGGRGDFGVVATTVDDYVSKAIRLAVDAEHRARVRRTIATRKGVLYRGGAASLVRREWEVVLEALGSHVPCVHGG